MAQLRSRFGLRGARAIVRRHGVESVLAAVADYDAVEGEGVEIRSPGGFLVWLLREQEACDE